MKARVLKSVLVDLDGTLADSLPELFNFYQTFLRRYQCSGSQAEFQQLNGATIWEVVQHLKQKYRLPESIENLYAAYQDGIARGYALRIKLFPNAKNVLQHLFDRGLTLAIVTSAKRPLLEAFLKNHQLSHLFTFTCTGEEISKGKPNPEIYEKAFQHLTCAKENVCVIEDSSNGIQAALLAGFHVFALNSAFPAHPEVTKVLNWNEIEAQLQKHYELSDL